MKHLAVILIVALIGAVVLLALSEFGRAPQDTAVHLGPAENGKDTDFSSAGLGLSAQLPGRGWTEGTAPDGTGVWFNPGKELAFVVRPTGQSAAGSDSEFEDHVVKYANNTLTRNTVDSEDFHGSRAYRVEGLPGSGPLQNYHCLGYILAPHGQETALLVCASPTAYDASHRTLMGSILFSVVLK